jgi:hypothetical protein
MPTCPVCKGLTGSAREFDGGEREDVSCSGCGNFVITKTALRRLEKDLKSNVILSHWIARTTDTGHKPEIDDELMAAILAEQTVPSVLEQTDRILLWLGDELLRQGRPNARISFTDRHRKLAALVGAPPEPGGGLMYLLQGLGVRGYLVPTSPSQYSDHIGLTLEGWSRYEELKRTEIESRIAFMAMPFGDAKLDKVFADFRNAVSETGFELRRIIDTPPAGLIDDRLRVEIRKSRFVICELTNANAGAYWEAGYAEGLGRPVIYSCEKTFFQQKGTHFDTNHCHTVLWTEDNLGNAAAGLKATIRATLPAEAKLIDT